MTTKPLIAITMGDPAGIGPEIIAKVFESGEVLLRCRPFVVGNADVIKKVVAPAGLLVKSLLPRDPTGEMVQLLEQLDSGTHPQLVEGAWASGDGTRAFEEL